MTIKVYDTIMPAEPVEVYEDHGMTVEAWVQSKTPNYKRGSVQPLSCSVNGAIVKPMDWADVVIRERDNIEFRVMPFGDALNFFLPFIGGSVALAQAALDFFTPDIPGQRGQGNQGQQLEPADARANQARLGQGVPELLGRYIRYPDYVNQPYRYYEDTRTQALRLMLCVGVGRYQISADDVRIGETPIGEIDGASYQLFEPGASVAGVENHENWYTAPEVGATTGGAGLRLRGVTFDERTYSGSAAASGDTLSGITVGELWDTNLRGTIDMTQTVTVVDDVTADIFQGAFQHLLAGMTVNVTSNAGVKGTYVVRTINGSSTEITLETTGGVAVTDAITGTRQMAIDKDGTEYKLTAINSSSSIDVERVLSGGATDPDWADTLPQGSLAAVDIEWYASTFTTQRSGPFLACPSGETTDVIEVDIFAPNGLGVVDGESINSRSRTIRIEYKDVSAGSYTAVTRTVSGGTRDQLGWSFRIDVGSPITPEVRISRDGAEDVSVTSLDRLEVTALKSRLPTVTSYDDVTTMAVTIVGSDEISNQSNNRVNVVAQRLLEPVAGGTESATRSISRAAVYVARTLGYDDDQIGIAEFEQLESVWESRGDYFDYVFSDGTVLDAIKTILRAGFADITLDTGAIVPIRDEPRTVLEQGYSPENMTAPLRRQFNSRQPDESDGVEVEYTNADTWTKETVMCLLPGDQQVKVDKIKLDGVTDRTRAWRIGMRRRRAQRYRRWTYSFSTELDALNSQYLSYVPLLDDIPGYGKVAILEGIQSDRIVVSEPLEWVAGETHVVAYRDENGDVVGPFTATEGPDEYTVLVTIPQPWPAALPANREPTHIYFGTTARWHFPALITEISPSGPLEVGVTATNYDERVYTDDSNFPP